jgi:magnesium-transporting ATPase (P-type)
MAAAKVVEADTEMRTMNTLNKFTINATMLADLTSAHSEGGAEKYAEMGGQAQILKAICVDKTCGINSSEVAERTSVFGSNENIIEKPAGFCEECLDTFNDTVMIALTLAGVLQLVTGTYEFVKHGEPAFIDGIALIGTVCIVTFIGAYMNYSKNMKYYEQKCAQGKVGIRVKRDNKWSVVSKKAAECKIFTDDIVVGDIVHIETGVIVAADMLLLSQNSDVKMSQAALTGETNDVKKDPENDPFLLAGTKCMAGDCEAVVVAVGSNSQSGIIRDKVNNRTENIQIDGGDGKPARVSVESTKTTVVIENITGDDVTVIQGYIKDEKTFQIGHTAGLKFVSIEKGDQDTAQVEMLNPWTAATVRDEPLFWQKKVAKEDKSVLEVKLDIMAINIGYVGLIVAIITIIIIMSAHFAQMGNDGRKFYLDLHCETDGLPKEIGDACNLGHKEDCRIKSVPTSDHENGIDTEICKYTVLYDDMDDCSVVAAANYSKFDYSFENCEDHDSKWGHTFEQCHKIPDYEAIIEAFITGIAILVVAVPEGLPLAVTLALVYAQSQMMLDPYNCMVRRMAACETMGSATAICSDKTGTLTTNKMVVDMAYLGGQLLADCNGQQNKVSNAVGHMKNFDPKFKKKLLQVSTLCSKEESRIEKVISVAAGSTKKLISLKYEGNNTECAILNFANQCELHKLDGDDVHDIYAWRENAWCTGVRKNKDTGATEKVLNSAGLRKFPFESSIKRMTVVAENKETGGSTVLTKGAAEVLVKYCTRYMSYDGNVYKMTDAERTRITRNIEDFADKTLRNISLAYREIGLDAEGWKAATKKLKEISDKQSAAEDAWEKKKEAYDKAKLDNPSQVQELPPRPEEMLPADQIDLIPDEPVGAAIDKGDAASAGASKTAGAGASGEDFEVLGNKGAIVADMIYMGLVGIKDPLRRGVPESVTDCLEAGVRVRMCTGDNIRTARAIAHACNLIEGKMNGTYIQTKSYGGDSKKGIAPKTTELIRTKSDKLGDDGMIVGMEGPYFRHLCWDLQKQKMKMREDSSGEMVPMIDKIWPQLRVLARCKPNDKLVLVRGMQDSQLYVKCKKGHPNYPKTGGDVKQYPEVCAVTGDGTNDAPAISEAAIGFAMGIEGTQVAQDASDIILTTDNFNSIVMACMWGRNVYDSIVKFLQFQLTVNVVALFINVWSALISAFWPKYYGVAVPLQPVQMLWVNLIMDSLASLALATEMPDRKLLQRMPYAKDRSLLTGRLYRFILIGGLYQIIVLLLFMHAPSAFGIDEEDEARGCGSAANIQHSMIFNVFVIMTCFNEINARKLKDECNVFENLLPGLTTRVDRGLGAEDGKVNWTFNWIWIGTMVLQVMAVQIPFLNERVFKCKGLNLEQWLWCLLFGVMSLPWGIAVRVLLKPAFFQPLKECIGEPTVTDAARQMAVGETRFHKTKVFEALIGGSKAEGGKGEYVQPAKPTSDPFAG